jgi:exopolysaccharide production protein ExoQ
MRGLVERMDRPDQSVHARDDRVPLNAVRVVAGYNDGGSTAVESAEAQSVIDLRAARKSHNLRRLRLAFYTVYLACAMGLNVVVLIPRDSLGEFGDNRNFAISWVLLYLLSIVVLASMARIQDSRNLVFVVVIGAFILGSTGWSLLPEVTAIYGTMLVGNIIVAHLIASELSLREIVTLVTRVVLILTVLGIAAYFLGYEQATYFDAHQRPNLFGGIPIRGFFTHKIMASLFAVIGAIGVLATMRGGRRLFFLSLLGVFVAMTSSATGLVLFLMAVALFPLVNLFARKRVRPFDFFVILSVAGLLAAVVGLAQVQSVLEDLGRDPTLTGRTYLWSFGLDVWKERPLVGWGFNAYLNSDLKTEINAVFRALGDYDVPHFHQSFLQTAVDFGLVGLVFLVYVIGYVLITSYRYAVSVDRASGVFAFVSMSVMCVAATTMFLFFNYNHFATLLTFMLFFALRRGDEEMRAGRPSTEIDEQGASRASGADGSAA